MECTIKKAFGNFQEGHQYHIDLQRMSPILTKEGKLKPDKRVMVWTPSHNQSNYGVLPSDPEKFKEFVHLYPESIEPDRLNHFRELCSEEREKMEEV